MGKNGLPGPRLPRDRVQALTEAQPGPFDQQQVFDSQFAQHRPPCLATRGDGIALAGAQWASTSRTSRPPASAPANTMIAAISRISLSAEVNAASEAAATRAVNSGGAAAVAAAVPPLAIASESSWGAAGSAAETFESMLPWKTAPSPATPVAMPTWRKVVLIPDAMPARSWETTLIATVPMFGLVMP